MRPLFARHRLRTATTRRPTRDRLTFVRALLAPYRRREVASRRFALPMVRRAAIVTATAERHHRAALTLAWRLNVLVTRVNAAAGPTSARVGLPPARPTSLTRSSVAPVAAAAPQRDRMALPLRLMARMTRVDLAASPAVAAPSPLTAVGSPAASARQARPFDALPVVKGSPKTVASPEMTTARNGASVSNIVEARTKSVAAARGSVASAIDGAELQRLASRVIASIDDRITAARERLGSH